MRFCSRHDQGNVTRLCTWSCPNELISLGILQFDFSGSCEDCSIVSRKRSKLSRWLFHFRYWLEVQLLSRAFGTDL